MRVDLHVDTLYIFYFLYFQNEEMDKMDCRKRRRDCP